MGMNTAETLARLDQINAASDTLAKLERMVGKLEPRKVRRSVPLATRKAA